MILLVKMTNREECDITVGGASEVDKEARDTSD